MDLAKETLSNETQLTENGAIGYKTTGTELLDFNFKVASMRHMSEEEIADMFTKCYYENPVRAIRYLFFLRDREQGLGERRTFRAIIVSLANNHPELTKSLLPFVPLFGRFDDWFVLLDTSLKNDIIKAIKLQLNEDLMNCEKDKPISLLSKWLPSSNTSSAETRRKAKIIYKSIGMPEKDYRQMLSVLRKHLDVVEVKMSSKNWGDINYNNVPSRANLIYNNAFLRNDEERRRQYLADLASGKEGVKINAGVLFPHDVVAKYASGGWYGLQVGSYDEGIEQLWKNLPDFVGDGGNTLVVRDGSGSMTCKISGNISALHVSTALSIYFAEKCKGEFHDKFITFSARPEIIDMSECKNLHDKLELCNKYDDCSNTDIKKTFELILDTAINNHLTQEELPKNVLIVSDMEFDMGVRCDKTLFAEIEDEFKEAGYQMPRLIFWNVNSRTGTIPVKQNELGVALVSGFSPAICKMVVSNELDPMKCLLEQINNSRYDCIEEAVKEAI